MTSRRNKFIGIRFCNTNETEFDIQNGINIIPPFLGLFAQGAAMYKAFILLFFLVLFSCSSAQTIGQVTPNKAEQLLHEGIQLTGSGQFAQAVRAFEEAIK